MGFQSNIHAEDMEWEAWFPCSFSHFQRLEIDCYIGSVSNFIATDIIDIMYTAVPCDFVTNMLKLNV